MAKNKFAFTICSNNYLGQANALKDSFLRHNKDFQFYIFLVDEFSDAIDYSIFEPATLILAKDIRGIDFNALLAKYYIIELNTNVKASAFKHLISLNPNLEAIYYLDPDLFFYDSLHAINKVLQDKAMALTPHILTPIARDGKFPDENTFLQFGVFNLGFIGLSPQHQEALQMLDWWEHRILNYGFDRPQKGYFVDQLWMNFAPIFYDKIEIIKSFGYNMAPWNLHERNIVEHTDDVIKLNDGNDLVFYHFSKITLDDENISREFNRFKLSDLPLLKQLYMGYYEALKGSKYEEFKKINIAYDIKTRTSELEAKIKPKPKQNTLEFLLKKVYKALKK
ncbi:hypothetical protein KH5_19760 [Urechidicola sp. KH5]